MWKERANYTSGGGDLEMVGTSSGGSTEDSVTFNDEFDDQGYSMPGAGQRRKLQTGKSRVRCCCWTLLLVAILALAVTYFFIPQGLLNQLVGSSSSDQDDNNADNSGARDNGSSSSSTTHSQVSKDAVIDNSAYQVTLQLPLNYIQGNMVLYQHRRTKTPVITILPYDREQDNVFGISFRTKPSNSHGAPHVLEHSVLAGSKKYPIKDPFTQVLKGSLQTFVNAWTADDLTSYICASRNDVDMKNLMSVYMDAVFAPLVVEGERGIPIFRQEGWRVEMNETGEPVFNGVVLSEMKGAMANPEEILGEFVKQIIFPDTVYQYNSGGEPKVIPDLSHAELIEFYKTFYHPSNAQVFLYGSKTTAENCLTQLDEYLSTYEPRPDIRNDSTIELQPLQDLPPTMLRIPIVAGDSSKVDNHQVMKSWLISADGNTTDDEFQRQNRLLFEVLDELLMNDKNGALYLALQNSGLAGSVKGGLDNSYLQWTFDVLATNVNGSNVQAVADLTHETLQQIVHQGFDDKDMEAAMNTVEFSYRDMSSSGGPRGIMLFMNVMQTWKFDLDPLTGFLSFEDDFQDLKQRVKDQGSDLFTAVIQDNLINNGHSAVMELYPDPLLAQQNEDEEQKRLIKLRQSQKFPTLLDQADSLAERQVTDDPPEMLALIPSVTVQDLAKKGYEPPILKQQDKDGSGVTVLVHEVASSFGIIYIDFGVDISMLEFDDIILISILAELMIEGGTDKYNVAQIARQIGTYTGGIKHEFLLHPILPPNATTQFLVPDGEHFHTKLFLRGAATKERGADLLEILSQIMFHPLLDSKERGLAILRERIAKLEQRLAGGTTLFPEWRIQARYSAFGFISEEESGVSSLPKLRKVLETAESDWASFLNRLTNMKNAILRGNRKGMILNLTGEKAVLQQIAPKVSRFLTKQLNDRGSETQLPNFAKAVHPWVPEAKQRMAADSPVRNEGIVMATKVNYVGSGAPLYGPYSAIPGSTAAVTQFIEYNNFMLQIRERRGAYGAFAMLDPWMGFLTYMTFRDPNVYESLRVYEEVPTYLKEQMQHSSTAIKLINSAIIGTIGSLDGSAPQPDRAGWTSMIDFLSGSNAKIRQRWRDDILGTNNNDFLEYAIRLHGWPATVGVGGPKNALLKEKDLNLTLIDEL